MLHHGVPSPPLNLVFPLVSLSFSLFSHFLTLCNCVFTEVDYPGLVGSAVACGGSAVEQAWPGRVWHRAGPHLTEATLAALLVQKPCCRHPVH